MKPPPRTRTKPKYHQAPEPSPDSEVTGGSKWSRGERRKLLIGLKSLNRRQDRNQDIDYDFLKTYVPTRSVQEIHCMVESLKDKAVSHASYAVMMSQRQKKRLSKPIELWTEMASSVTGTLELPISTAFSQVLKVASTEPCTLKNCDPPQLYRTPTDKDRPFVRTIPLRPAPCSPVRGQPPRPSAAWSLALSTGSAASGTDAVAPPTQQKLSTSTSNSALASSPQSVPKNLVVPVPGVQPRPGSAATLKTPSPGSQMTQQPPAHPSDPVLPSSPSGPVLPSPPSDPVLPSSPSVPVLPSSPSGPVLPSSPSVPVLPSPPSVPVLPSSPSVPVLPSSPSVPVLPSSPSVPVLPSSPSVPVLPSSPSGPVLPRSPSGPVLPSSPSGPVLPSPPSGPVLPSSPSVPVLLRSPSGPVLPSSPSVPVLPSSPSVPVLPSPPSQQPVSNLLHSSSDASPKSTLSTTAATLNAKSTPTRKDSTRDTSKTAGSKCPVDFAKIYCYLSLVDKKDEQCHLTPMESAIVLDLLMSLPEEVRLLDCNKLHKHLIQVYACLSSPADSKMAQETLRGLKDGLSSQHSNTVNSQQDAAATVGSNGDKNLQPDGAASQLLERQKTSMDSDKLPLCPPLNPFMIPVKLLMRK